MRYRLAFLALTAAALAQTPIQVDEARQSSRIIWNSGVERPVEVRIEYGPCNVAQRARARSDRQARGHLSSRHRGLGNAAQQCRNPFGDRKLPAGIWYLALHRDAAANWQLAVIDPTKARLAGIQAGNSRDAKPSLLAPMQLHSDREMREGLQIALCPATDDDKRLGRINVAMRWGTHELSAQCLVDVRKAESKSPKFRALDAARTITTESGLRYEELRAGTGDHPVAAGTVRTHYTGWLTDGSKFDSSLDRGKPISFPLSGVIKGWTEGLQKMKPGSVFLFEIPPDLGYGARGVPPTIPPESTLIFWIELLAIEK